MSTATRPAVKLPAGPSRRTLSGLGREYGAAAALLVLVLVSAILASSPASAPASLPQLFEQMLPLR